MQPFVQWKCNNKLLIKAILQILQLFHTVLLLLLASCSDNYEFVDRLLFFVNLVNCNTVDNMLTHFGNFNFTDIKRIVDQWKLYNDVSETLSVVVGATTVDTDCSSIRYSPRILTTQSVVPQNRCVDDRMSIG